MNPVFNKFGQYPPIIEDADLYILEKFVITIYDKHITIGKVNEPRLGLFALKQSPYDAIPPTKTSFFQHMKRFALQALCVWGQATECKMQTKSPAKYCWQTDGEVWQVL